MDALQGAVLGVKLPRLDGWNAERRQVAARYSWGSRRRSAGRAGPIGLDHACHVYALRVDERDGMRAALAEDGVATGIHYPTPGASAASLCRPRLP